MCEVQNLQGTMILQNNFPYHQPLSQAAILKLHDTTYIRKSSCKCVHKCVRKYDSAFDKTLILIHYMCKLHNTKHLNSQ